MMGTPSGRIRQSVLDWLKDPAAHFPPTSLHPGPADPAGTGVTARAVAAKLGVPRRTAAAHLDFLTRLGLLRTRRRFLRTYYRRDEARIAEVAQLFEKNW
ncbi:helix-turn-helix domain-containing protein [Streptomyces sp. BV129]|uniref:helix-turn-helix domain-containing protein n=1 Tax=Streptomyces sp. BV129 TaxID=2849671 RepID=UPI001C2E1E41|nr:helix-turn-helix domain-containing protein [Streptomyces sp. BV129]MBV1949005.1 helix-turn-helix domain-containing protein [Streptomyces sp. BV129]